jgi:hypothetical protein
MAPSPDAAVRPDRSERPGIDCLRAQQCAALARARTFRLTERQPHSLLLPTPPSRSQRKPQAARFSSLTRSKTIRRTNGDAIFSVAQSPYWVRSVHCAYAAILNATLAIAAMKRIYLHSLPGHRCVAAAVCFVASFIAAALQPDRAAAQAKLEADYAITFARLAVGSMTLSVAYGTDDYGITATVRAGGVMRVLANGDASMTVEGTVKDGVPLPASFSSKATSGTATEEVRMVLEDGSVKELILSPIPENDLPSATEAERQGIVDPLTAMLVPTSPGEPIAAEACQRTFRIFDGRHRYDLSLAFRRKDNISGEKGYAGPVIVCAVNYRPIAGQRDLTPLEKYLMDGGEMEIALAPITGIAMLAPVRFSATGALATLVITATRFDAAAQLRQ